ncbi:MAG TPA: hypothetical protein VJV05_01365 [Pyrinomonadaceae bacterium]|nr:hypothetical protein [Pyrinomonadaceae bacterium]
MKICPTCRKTYDDDALNFCLDDGSLLNIAFDDSAAPTIAMHQPQPTIPSQGRPSMQPGWGPPSTAPHSMQPPKKKSRGWLWAIGILGLVVLLCGGGVAGFFVYVASVADDKPRVASNSNDWHSNTPGNSSTNSSVDPSRVQSIALDEWAKQTSSWGTNEFKDGELYMATREKGNYFVIVAPEKFKTEKVTTRVTVRNADNVDSGLGYGLVIHSDSTPLQNDYAFLIDSKRKRYRVVKHDPENEIAVVPWTTSKLIKDGTSDNVIEARDKSGKIELYLNGELATSFTNKGGPTGGVPGLYTGDGAKIAFKKLEIIK